MGIKWNKDMTDVSDDNIRSMVRRVVLQWRESVDHMRPAHGRYDEIHANDTERLNLTNEEIGEEVSSRRRY